MGNTNFVSKKFVIMESLTRAVPKYIINTIYVLNHKKGKKYVQNQVFEAIKSKIISRKQVYRLLDRLEKKAISIENLKVTVPKSCPKSVWKFEKIHNANKHGLRGLD